MSELARFQDAFTAALRSGGVPCGYGDPARLEAGMSVYRNTTFKGALDALRANYPTVERLVGSDWFTASACAFLEVEWPGEPSLVAFGAGFPDFLATFGPARSLAYLPGVARLDRFWTEAHIAPDAPVLERDALSGLPPDTLFGLSLQLHPSARLGWFVDPSPTIWRLNRPPTPEPTEIQVDWRPEGALVARPDGQVEALIIDAAGFAFLGCCLRGETLGHAATAALNVEPEADLTRQIAQFIEFGAFQPLSSTPGGRVV